MARDRIELPSENSVLLPHRASPAIFLLIIIKEFLVNRECIPAFRRKERATMGMKSSLVRIGSSLLMLTIFSGTASSSDTNNPESVSLAVTSACDFTDCAQEFEPCQAFLCFAIQPNCRPKDEPCSAAA